MIKEDSFETNLEVMRPLWKMHWQEVYGTDEANIWEEHYIACEKAGMLLTLFAFYEQVVVGYSVNIISPNMHKKPHITCINDALYIDPVFRDGPLGIKLIKETERKGKERGADLMVWHAPLNTNLIHILPRMSYKAEEVVFSKEL